MKAAKSMPEVGFVYEQEGLRFEVIAADPTHLTRVSVRTLVSRGGEGSTSAQVAGAS